ncbi:MAG: phage major capsid protein [Succinatimonas sp.]|nr:phage major capsid protein [Succinatimonas sp.]
MDENLKNELNKLVESIAKRSKEVQALDEKLKKYQDDNSSALGALQTKVDDLTVRLNRPQGGNVLPKKGNIGSILRSFTGGKEVYVTRDATAATTTSHQLLVLPQFLAEIIRQENATTFVRQLFNFSTVSTPDIRGRIGSGLTVSHVGEGQTRAKTENSTFTEVKPSWSNVYTYPEVTVELLQDDSYDLESWYITEVGTGFGLATEQDILVGAGTGNACKGLFKQETATTADGQREVTKFQAVASAKAGVVTFDDLKKLVGSLRYAYRAGASFLINHDLFVTLTTLKDANGNYLMQKSVSEAEPGTLLGYPVYDSEYVPAISTTAKTMPLAFGNFKRAAIGYDRPQISIIRDDLTNKGFVGFYTAKRFGFMIKDTSALKFLSVDKTAS